MEPMLVPEEDSALDDLTFDLNRITSRLAGSMPLEIQQELARLVRSMNCYYSNFLERAYSGEDDRLFRRNVTGDSAKPAL